MNRATKKYSKEFLDSHGIWIEYIVNPSTFKPHFIFFSKHNINWKLEKEFDVTNDKKTEYYINEIVDELITLNRNMKIKKILNR